MNTPLQRLVDALRDELQHYGEVLALLDDVPEPAALPAGDGVAPVALPREPFRDAAERLLDARGRRERRQQQVAWASHQPDAWTPPDLLPVVPGAVRPLLRALFDEIESLQGRLAGCAHPQHPWLGQGGDPILITRLLDPSAPPVSPAVLHAAFRRPQPDALSA